MSRDKDLDVVAGDLEDRRSYYRGVVNYEAILAKQISRVAEYRSEKNIPLYEESVDTLILMMPLEMRNKALEYKKKHNIVYGGDNNGKALYDDLWQFSNELLERGNLIFKTSTFEIGRA